MKCNECEYNTNDHGCKATMGQMVEIGCDLVLDDSPMAYWNAMRQSCIFRKQFEENHKSKGEPDDKRRSV